MSLPTDSLSAVPTPAQFLSPDSTLRLTRVVDYERAGVAVQDASQGLLVRDWTASLAGDDVTLYPSDDPGAAVTLFTLAGITHLSLAFSRNMDPAIAYVVGGQAYLWWYDATVVSYVTLTLEPDARAPMITMDDKRRTASSRSDILLFYARGHQIMCRQQRDRFLTERLMYSFPGSQISVRRVGMSRGQRVQVEVVGSDSRTNKLVTYASSWTAALYQAAATSFAVAMPENLTAATLLLAFVMTRSAPSTPAGWTLVTSKDCTDGTTTQKLSVYKKNAVTSGDSAANVTWTQASAVRLGVAYVAVKRSNGSTPVVAESATVAVDSTSTLTVTPTFLTATKYQELFIMAATTILATNDVTQPTPPIYSSLRSGSSSQTRLGVSVRARYAMHKNEGHFVFAGTPALNGLAAITLRISA